MLELNSDVCVIGGGPAGSSIARRLWVLGHTVTLVEKARFPRPHIGESVTAAVLPLLEILGVRDCVESAGFLRPKGAHVFWAAQVVQYRDTPGDAGFQFDRERFDGLLLEAARSAGALILQPSSILYREHTQGLGWKIQVQTDGGAATIRARALADASGRSSITGGKKQILSPATLALSGYWRGVKSPGFETRIEAGADAWYWGAPLASGDFNATVFIEPRRYRLGVLNAGSRERFYRELLYQSRLLRSCLCCQLVQGPKAHDATCYVDTDPARAENIKAGEAAFTIDPLSSQGIVTAIGTGLHAAAVLHTILERPRDTNIALEFYRSRVQHSAAFHSQAASAFYSDAAECRPSTFWRARAQQQEVAAEKHTVDSSFPRGSDLVGLSRDVRLGPVAVVEGDFITTGQGVFAPTLKSPAVYSEGVPLALLFSNLTEPVALSVVLERWEKSIPPRVALHMLT